MRLSPPSTTKTARISRNVLVGPLIVGGQRRSLWWKSSTPAPGKSDVPADVDSVAASSSTPLEVAPIAETPSTSASVAVDSAATSPETTETAVSSVVDSLPLDAPTTLLASPPPLEFGDLAALGLISYTPAGFIRWSFELINVTTALPWFHTIVVGSLLWRALLTPFVIQNLQNTARLQPIQPKLLELRDEMKRASESGDRLAMQRCALKQKKIYGDAGVSMGKMMLTPFIQLPVTLGLFFGVRKMCSLPVEQLKESGLSWLPDLTVPDPLGLLPWVLMVVVNIQISVSGVVERPEMGHFMNALRVLTLGGVWVMGDFPSGLMVSLLVTSTATTAQTLILQSPTVRRYFNIPIVPLEHKGKLPSFRQSIQYVVDTYHSKIEEAKRAQQQDMMKRRRYRGHRAASFEPVDINELVELRARQRTFHGAYSRTALGCLGYSLTILRLFDRRFYKIGLLFAVLGGLMFVLSFLRARHSRHDFADYNEEAKEGDAAADGGDAKGRRRGMRNDSESDDESKSDVYRTYHYGPLKYHNVVKTKGQTGKRVFGRPFVSAGWIVLSVSGVVAAVEIGLLVLVLKM
ncbi:Mitochondrial inner membrane protein oxa1 [Pleurotus pulmonarius]|nr:Mitochondrial inner membrane protein oxa1 [Pleurotus pulmonarius]